MTETLRTDHVEVREPLVSARDILVVDDNETNLISIEAAIEPLGRKLVFARSGSQALRALLEQDFALILLDMAMAGLDGFETARLVRSRDRNRLTPIIFITSFASNHEAKLRGYDLGAFDYLPKPIEPEILRAKARVFVELQDAQLRAHRHELEAQRRQLEASAMELQVRQLLAELQPLLTAIEAIEASGDQPVEAVVKQILRHHLDHVRNEIKAIEASRGAAFDEPA